MTEGECASLCFPPLVLWGEAAPAWWLASRVLPGTSLAMQPQETSFSSLPDHTGNTLEIGVYTSQF